MTDVSTTWVKVVSAYLASNVKEKPWKNHSTIFTDLGIQYKFIPKTISKHDSFDYVIMLQNCLLLFHTISKKDNGADRKLFTIADSSGVEHFMDMVIRSVNYSTWKRL